MKDKLKTIAINVGVALFIAGSVYLTVIYKFQDCRKVGHSIMYCLLDVG